MDVSQLFNAKFVERKVMAQTLKITLKQTILKESSSPATSAIKLSGLEMVLGNIRDNMKTKCFMNFYIVEHIYVVILLGVGII